MSDHDVHYSKPMKYRGTHMALGMTLVGVLVLLASDSAWAAGWKRTGSEAGIELFERESKDAQSEEFVEFKGVTRIRANIRELVAIMYSYPHRHRWMKLMERHELLERRSASERVFYNRFTSPFFMVSDRDVNTLITSKFYPAQRKIITDIVDIEVPSRPAGKGAVRIPVMRGRWTLKATGPSTTWISYELHTHPGGWIPDWVAKRVTRGLPAYTLKALRKQVGNASYETSRQEIRYIFNWDGFPEAEPATAQVRQVQPTQPAPQEPR